MSLYVGLLLQLPPVHLAGDKSAQLPSCERLVRDNEVQSRKIVDDDLKMGVVTLGMHDSRVREHLVRNTGSRRETKLWKIARTQQYINSQPTQMQPGATPKGKGEGEGEREGHSNSTATVTSSRNATTMSYVGVAAPVLESSDAGRSGGTQERRGGRSGHWTSLSGHRGLLLQRSMQ